MGQGVKSDESFFASLLTTRRGFWPQLVLLVLMLVVCGAAWLMRPTAVLLLAIGVGGGGALARVVARREVSVDGMLVVGAEGLFFRGAWVCDLAEIDAALMIPRRGRKPLVVLKRRGGRSLRFEVDGTDRGRALIRALGLDPRTTVATFTLPAMNQDARAAAFAGAAVVGLVGLVAIPVLGSLLPAAAVALAIVSYAAYVLLTRTRLHVGADGLRIQGPGKARFIGHGEIDRVTTCKVPYTAIEITLHTGEVVRVPTATHSDGDIGLAAGIADLVEAARSSAREDVAREASLLARNGRTAADWLRGMRALSAGANADHRTAPVDPANVWRVLEDPSADASARVGAAAMLAATADTGDRTRLRVAAEAIAAPPIRVAIGALADGADDDALLEALDAVDDMNTIARPARRAGGVRQNR